MPRLLVAFILGLLVQHANAETLVMEAPEGKYDAGAIGDLSEVSNVSTSFRVTKQSKNLQWPPAAYVGFYQGANRNDSFQFLVIKDQNVGATEMAVGYRVIEGGKEKTVAYLATIEASTYAKVELGFNKGVTFRDIPGRTTIFFESQSWWYGSCRRTGMQLRRGPQYVPGPVTCIF